MMTERDKILLNIPESIRKMVVGVSGGADSVALLHSLHGAGRELLAVHCNFHLRGEESDRDMRFVERLCERLGVPLEIVHFDVEAFREKEGGSVEMACRKLRYNKFREIMARTGADRIAVAHNADDQAETLLLNLMRGGGVSGLRAMKPDTGRIIRPLLHTSRREIEDYLEANNLDFITDSTNLSSDYRRNFLRNEIIPALETRWPEAKSSLCRTASIMQQEERMLDWAENRLSGNDPDILPLRNLLEAPDTEWLLRRFLIRHNIAESVTQEILRSIKADPFQSGKQWRGDAGILTLERDRLEYFAPKAAGKIITEVSVYDADEKIKRSVRQAPLTELWTPLPPDQISFRYAEEGDSILPLGMKGSIKVSKIMKDAKLSYSKKRTTIVGIHTATGTIIWIDGLKRSQLHLVGNDSTKIYRYKVKNS